jgi:hypothetical protein
MIAGIVLLGCGDAVIYTLYRNSPVIPDARLHVATFDSADGGQYHSEFQQQPGVKTTFWCEKGRFRG